MTLDAPPFDLDWQRLYLEAVAIDQPNPFSTAGARRRAELNQIGLAAFLAWLQTELAPAAQVWPRASALPSFWEIVTGTAIDMGQRRLVIMPTEAIDAGELRIPQEWVDIPTWVADYYVLLQVNTDEAWVAVMGYAPHHRVKTQGQYDPADRTYTLSSDQLITDINVIGLAQQFCPTEPTRAEVSPLTELTQSQAHNLLNRLGNAAVILPRLAIPFTLWGSLLGHGGWRQRLYEQRQGYAEQWSMSQWLQGELSQLAAQFGWRLDAPPALATGLRGAETGLARPSLAQRLLIAGNFYELKIGPQGEVGDRIWQFTLTSADADRLIPAGFQLRLLTEDLQPFEHNIDTANAPTAALYLQVRLEPGEGIVWEIEPMPEAYDREILRF